MSTSLTERRSALNFRMSIRAAASLALWAAATLAVAQPSPTVKILVGFPPGGVVDAVARAYADQARQVTGATVVVENRAGASGKLATDAVVNAPADGLTLVVAPASVLQLAPVVTAGGKGDPLRELAAVGSLAEYGFAVAAGPASGATTVAAFQAWAKTNAAASTFASPGLGTPQQFLGAQLRQAWGVELVHVPYKGGALAINDVLGGQVPLLITTEQLLVPHEGQGRLHTLFITSRKRNPLLPATPTAREIGLPQLETVDWFGLFAKAGTPPDKLEAWRGQVKQVLASPGYVEAMKRLGYGVPERQAADFAALQQAERAAWVERVRLSGFKASE